MVSEWITAGARAVLMLVARLLPFGVLLGLWSVLSPRQPYGGGDYAAIAVIATGCVLAFLLFDRLVRRIQPRL